MDGKLATWWNNRTPAEKTLAVGGSALAIYLIGKNLFSTDNSGGTTGSLSCGSNTSYTNNEYATLADTIETSIWGTWWIPSPVEDDLSIAAALMLMNTTDDVCRLNNAYGVRTRGVLLEDGGNLVQTIHAYLDEDKKAEVNAYYVTKGINWSWI